MINNGLMVLNNNVDFDSIMNSMIETIEVNNQDEWEIKNLLFDLIDQFAELVTNEIHQSKDRSIIDSSEWFDGISVINTLQFKMKSIIGEMWFDRSLFGDNAKQIFCQRFKESLYSIEK